MKKRTRIWGNMNYEQEKTKRKNMNRSYLETSLLRLQELVIVDLQSVISLKIIRVLVDLNVLPKFHVNVLILVGQDFDNLNENVVFSII